MVHGLAALSISPAIASRRQAATMKAGVLNVMQRKAQAFPRTAMAWCRAWFSARCLPLLSCGLGIARLPFLDRLSNECVRRSAARPGRLQATIQDCIGSLAAYCQLGLDRPAALQEPGPRRGDTSIALQPPCPTAPVELSRWLGSPTRQWVRPPRQMPLVNGSTWCAVPLPSSFRFPPADSSRMYRTRSNRVIHSFIEGM